MPAIVLTFPILPGKVEAWRRFCQEMAGSRQRAYQASRRQLGITHERWVLVENAYGSTSVTTLEAGDVGLALNLIAASEMPFDAWYRERVQDLHGVSLAGYEHDAQPVPSSHDQEVLFEWASTQALPQGKI